MGGMMYQFAFEDNGEVIDVDFETMMTMDAAGYVEICGRVARRINRPSVRREVEQVSDHVNAPMISDNAGFIEAALPQWEKWRQEHGFRSVEYRPDPQVPGFVQVHFHNRKERERYIKALHKHDRNSSNGSKAMLCPTLLSRTRKLVERIAADK